VALLAVSAELSTSAASASLALATLAFLLAVPRHGKTMAREPLLWCAGLFGLYLLARTAWAVREFPGTDALQWREASRLMQPWLFPVVGWWIAGRPRRLALVGLLGLAGFAAGVAWRWDADTLVKLSEFGRSGFGLPALAFALFSLTALLALVILAPRLTGPRHARGFLLRLLLWLLLAAVLAQGLVLTGSRTSWIAAAVVLPVTAILRYRATLRALPVRARVAAIVATLLLATVLLAANAERLRARLALESDTLGAIVRLDTANVPLHRYSSLGARYHLARYGLQRLAERPLTGWGPGGSRMLIDRAEPQTLRIWVDLHNTYLEIAVRLGAVGMAIFIAGAWFLWRGMRAAVDAGRLPRDWALFLGATLVVICVWSFTDFRLTHTDFRFYWLVIGGMAAGAAMRPRPTG